MELELWVFVVLFAVAVLAGGIDAIAGGGGLIVLPALLLAGVPPVTALGTNKFQGLFGTGSATFAFWQKGLIDLRSWGWTAIACGLASVIGAAVATRLPTDLLTLLMPIVLIGLAAYFLFKPDFDLARPSLVHPLIVACLVAPAIGFYDGIFGPGAGSLYVAAFVGLGGASLLAATVQTKLMNFASNVGGFIFFALSGAIFWKLGLIMAIGQIIGGRLGALLAIENGARLIRPLLVGISTVMALRLLWEALA
ncbi:MAG: TSUP family transporter [Pseudomonadota bacterium]